MPKNKKSKSKHGSALLLTTILLFVVLSMVLSLTYITVMEQKMSGKTKSSVGSFYSAESGVEWALNKIAGGSGTIQSTLSGVTTTSDGKISCPFSGTTCSVYFLDKDGLVIPQADFSSKDISEVKAVRSVGTQGDQTQRAIEAAVASGDPFEITCPSGFTNIKSSGNQLGCLETSLHGTNVNWFAAADACFDDYGGRLPIFSEWFVAIKNYTFSVATSTPYEWLGSSDVENSNACAAAQHLSDPETNASTFDCNRTEPSFSYRCWIPN